MTLTEAESARLILTSLRINCEIGESIDEGDFYVHVNDKMADGTEFRLMIYEWSVIYQSIFKARQKDSQSHGNLIDEYLIDDHLIDGHLIDHFSHIPFSRLNPSTN